VREELPVLQELDDLWATSLRDMLPPKLRQLVLVVIGNESVRRGRGRSSLFQIHDRIRAQPKARDGIKLVARNHDRVVTILASAGEALIVWRS
jgi:hypothetical protein